MKHADPVAQAEIDRLTAKVEAVKALGERMRWDRRVNGTAALVRLMLECIGENAADLWRQYAADMDRQIASAVGFNAEHWKQALKENREMRAKLRRVEAELAAGSSYRLGERIRAALNPEESDV